MENTLNECARRRKIQLEYNRNHNITPTTINKAIREGIEMLHKAKELVMGSTNLSEDDFDLESVLFELEHQMLVYARNLQFEEAAKTREEIKNLLTKYGLLENKTSIKLDATKDILDTMKKIKEKRHDKHADRR
jgi:excinuclease ABC subunit B